MPTRPRSSRIPLRHRVERLDLVLQRGPQPVAAHGRLPGPAPPGRTAPVRDEHREALLGEPLRHRAGPAVRPDGQLQPRPRVRAEQHGQRSARPGDVPGRQIQVAAQVPRPRGQMDGPRGAGRVLREDGDPARRAAGVRGPRVALRAFAPPGGAVGRCRPVGICPLAMTALPAMTCPLAMTCALAVHCPLVVSCPLVGFRGPAPVRGPVAAAHHRHRAARAGGGRQHHGGTADRRRVHARLAGHPAEALTRLVRPQMRLLRVLARREEHPLTHRTEDLPHLHARRRDRRGTHPAARTCRRAPRALTSDPAAVLAGVPGRRAPTPRPGGCAGARRARARIDRHRQGGALVPVCTSTYGRARPSRPP